MDACRQTFDLLDGLDAPMDDLRAEPRQCLIPDFKLIAVSSALRQALGGAFTQHLKQRVALAKRLIVFAQGARVSRDGLRQSQVEVTTAFLGTALDDLRHLRDK